MTVYISIWEEKNSKSMVVFPVAPETLPTEVGGKAETIDILGAGERVIFGGEKLDRFTLTSFFPARYDSSYVNRQTFNEPSINIGKLREWCDKEVPLRLYSKAGGLNRAVVITNLSYEAQRAGNIDDVFFTVDFINYKPPHFRKVAIKQAATGKGGTKAPVKKPTAKNADKLPAVYVVKKGDSLPKIAQAYYGKQDYQKLYDANKKLIDAENKKRGIREKYTVHPGQKLTIPAQKKTGTGSNSMHRTYTGRNAMSRSGG